MTQYLDYAGLTYYQNQAKNYFVAQVSGKALSTNDFTDALATKLNGIAAGANLYTLPVATATVLGGIKIGSNITIESGGTISLAKKNITDALGYTPLQTETNTTYSIAKVGSTVTLTGSDGSTTSFTDADTTYSDATGTVHGLMTAAQYTKLAGIATDADVSSITSVKLNGTALAITSKAVNIDLSSYALKSDVTSAVHYKGTVANYAALPTSGQTVGDLYNVTAADTTHDIKAGDNVVWSGTAWDPQSGSMDMSAYYTSAQTDSAISAAVGNISSITNAQIDSLFTA